MKYIVNKRLARYDVAVRAWAANDPVAAKMVKRVDSFRLDFSAADALLLGDQQTRVVTNQPLGGIIVGNTRDNDHRFDVVPMLEASAALGFAVPGTLATLSMGVRFEAWFGVYDQQTKFDPFNPGGTLGKKNAHRDNLGPYIRLEIPLGGPG